MKIGDRVNVCMTEDLFTSNIHNFGHVIPNCEILEMSSPTCDHWLFKTEQGIEFLMNPKCPNFIGLEMCVNVLDIHSVNDDNLLFDYTERHRKEEEERERLRIEQYYDEHLPF